MDVSVRDNGPYLIRGEDVKILDAEGNELAWEGRAVALCRCGQSDTKPFCDGAHSQVGFESTPRSS